jgi:beta-ribofuranosylaminobenzene 5'-phosphate synthase
MNNNGYRINGGIGFSVSEPIINCCFESSEIIKIIDEREIKFTDMEIKKLYDILKNIKDRSNLTKGIICKIQGEVLPHYGLGSNTSIYLSCIEALFLVNDIYLTQEEAVLLSKRGGTSGVGINTYFNGGFILDVGIKKEKQELVPSSIADRKNKCPLVIYKGKLPNWRIGICIPKYIKNKSEQEEIDFFKANCSIDKSSIGDILYESIYGITSSIIENDLNVFNKSVNEIQLTRWKFLERSLYGIELSKLENEIKNSGADCVGMSSFGPSLFFMGKNIDDIIIVFSNRISELKNYNAMFNNYGRIIDYD